MGVHVSDSSMVSDITFKDIEVTWLPPSTTSASGRPTRTHQPKLVHMAVVQDCWGRDHQRGQLRNIRFENISINGAMLSSDLIGFDETHIIDGISFRNVHCRGMAAVEDEGGLKLTRNQFARLPTVQAP
jgi:hypothetical protein